MAAAPWTLREYIAPDGKNPFGDWMRSLRDVNARARVRVRLNRLRLGNFGDVKPVGGGVSGLRIPYGPGYRVYLAREGDAVVLLLGGGDKSTQKRDINPHFSKAFYCEDAFHAISMLCLVRRTRRVFTRCRPAHRAKPLISRKLRPLATKFVRNAG